MKVAVLLLSIAIQGALDQHRKARAARRIRKSARLDRPIHGSNVGWEGQR